MILDKFKIAALFLLLLGVKIHSQSKNANDLFANHAMARKVNNAISFIEVSKTISLNDYNKSAMYILVSPNHSNAFAVSIRNELPLISRNRI